MNVEPTGLPDNAVLFMELPNCIMHNFLNKKKQKRAEGVCSIYRVALTEDSETPSNSEAHYYIKIKNNHVQTFTKNSTLLRINYPQNTSYIFEGTSGIITSLSFHKNCTNLEKFETHFRYPIEQQLSQFSVILNFDSENVSSELRDKIIEACPDKIQIKDICEDGKSYVKKIGKNIGFYFGKISNVTKEPVSGAGRAISERANRFSTESVSENTKTKWNNVVQKAAVINQFLSNLMRPIKNRYQNYSEQLGQSFNTSQNKFVATVREYSYAIRDSLNEGEREGINKEHEQNMLAQQSSAQLK